MKQLRITNEAKADLIDIWLYISQNNEDAADSLIDRIIGKYDGIGSIIWGSREKLKGKQAAQNVIKYDT
jgi:hypothetical protein